MIIVLGLGETQPQESNISEDAILMIRGTPPSVYLNPDRVDVLYDTSKSEIKVFDVSFKLTVSSE